MTITTGPHGATGDPSLPAVRRAAELVGARLNQRQFDQLDRLRSLVLDWTRRVNLTAVREPEAFEQLHLVDSLGLLRIVDQQQLAGSRLVDIGSGGGLPALPLAIVAPGLRLTMIEATGKKVVFLQTAVAALKLDGVEVIHGRAEELAHRVDLRERFALVTARAVGRLATLAELCLPFCHIGGRLLAQKTQPCEAELMAAQPALARCGGEVSGQSLLELPGLTDRLIIVVTKRRPTPANLPRRAGLPAHQPL
jgi:16S rRNA (guanine527-N7)-methyltransferase